MHRQQSPGSSHTTTAAAVQHHDEAKAGSMELNAKSYIYNEVDAERV